MKTRIRLSVVTNSFCSADDGFVPWSKEKPGKRRTRAKAYLFNRRKVAMTRNATSKTSASPHGAAGRSSKHKLISVPVPGYVQARVEALMRDLKTQLSESVLEACISALAEKYVYMIKPDPVIPSKRDTADQLSKVKKHGNALLISILSLQGPAIDALDLRHPTLGEFETSLIKLVEVASRAKVPTTANDRRGMKRKVRASEIAEAAADDFYHLTGRAPGLPSIVWTENQKSAVTSTFFWRHFSEFSG